MSVTQNQSTNCGRLKRIRFGLATWMIVLSALLGAGSAADPLTGSSLVLWLDAQDIRGDGKAQSDVANGTPIGCWTDKSSCSNSVTQEMREHQPTVVTDSRESSVKVVRFEAAREQFLRATGNASLNLTELTAFVVARAADYPANMWLFGKNHWGPPWTGYGIAVSSDGLRAWPHLGLAPGGMADRLSVQFNQSIRDGLAIVEICCDGQRLLMNLNGGFAGRRAARGGVAANDRTLLIGAGAQGEPACEYLQGDIAELLIYNRALDETQRFQTRQYLADKYAIALNSSVPSNLVIDNGYLPVIVENPATPETRTLSQDEEAAVLERDWLFQADGESLAARTTAEIGWTRQLAARLAKDSRTPCLAEDLVELDRLAQCLEADGGQAADAEGLYFAVRRVKRRIAFKNRALDFTQVLLIDQPYPAGPEWPHEAIHRMGHRAVPGGRLLVLDGLRPGGTVRRLAPETPGSFWRPDLSFDATRVLFCYKAHDEKSFHLYEIGLDGTDVRRLTSGDYDDLDPIYLPDGHVMFTTTRGNTYVRCGPYIYSTLLARCDADGDNLYLISQNSEPDFVPSLLSDGRVIYSRWEYTDKSVFRVQSLWTTHPDGTHTATFWGNQSVWPDHLAEPQQIPGSQRVMFAGVGHHDWFSGCIGIIDPSRGFNYPHGITKVTADLPWPEVGDGPEDAREAADYHASGRYSSYKTPRPLSPVDFLVSARGPDGKFRLYLMDVVGNRELIYEGVYNIWHAIPVKPRAVPPCLPDRVAWPGTGSGRQPAETGALYTADVYQGAADLPRGSVKYLRVLQSDPKVYSTWSKTFRLSGPPISVVYEESVKRILSEVAVKPDGSVYFEVPPGRALHFQLLDEHYRCLQTMRSFTGVMPGEHRGCVGCHESHSTAPALNSGAALRRPPRGLSPPPWGTESLGYERFVQPVLDRYCVSCHQGNAEAGGKLDLTLRPAVNVFQEPYLTLIGAAGWDNPVRGEGQPGFGAAGAIPVETMDNSKLDPRGLSTLASRTSLSYASRLVQLSADGTHYGVTVDPLSLRRLMAWVDCNCPYLGEEELRQLPDPEFAGVDELPIRPRVRTAPLIERP